MNMFAKSEANSVEEYLLKIPSIRQKDINFLHDFIQKTVPSFKPYFAYNMIGYGSFGYLDSKKQNRDWPVIALANQKNYISIYVCAVVEDGYVVEKYAKDLGKVSVGKSCIRFKNVEDLNLETLKTLLKIAEQNPGLVTASLV